MRHSVALRRCRVGFLGLCTAAGIGCQSVPPAVEPSAVAPVPAARTAAAVERRPAVVRPASPERVVTREQVLNWTARGVGDDVILDQLDGATCPSRIDTADEVHLHAAGVSNDVIQALRQAAMN